MKKQKLLISILTVFSVCFMCVAFSACNKKHTHSYTQQITTQATCTEKGVITCTCSCNSTFTVEIPATGVHTWDDGVITTKPTCTTKGVKTFTCTVCTTATYTEDVNALDHEFINYISNNDAKCGVDGTETATCNHDGCNEKDTRTDEDSALDHEFTNYVSDNNATYEKDGTKTAKCNHEGCLVTDTILDENTRRMEKIIILDSSASMRTTSDGTTRFERAVWEIFALSDNFFQKNGTISLILADNTPKFIAERSSATERETFFSNLDDLLENDKCSYGSADIKSAMALAENVLEQNTNAEILLYTGTDYTNSENVTVINVDKINEEWNAAILDCQAVLEDNYYTFYIDVACYNKHEIVEVYLDVYNINDTDTTATFSLPVRCSGDEVEKIPFQTVNEAYQVYTFSSAHAYIREKDSFDLDNSFYIYGAQKPVVKSQYASSNPNIFISGALYSLRNSLQDSWDISITETKVGNEPNLAGYDFYIFENESLTALPTDGAVFLINPTASSSDFSLGKTATGNFDLTFDNAHPITSNIPSPSATISSYTKISSYDSSFTPIIWCGNDPVCLVKNTPKRKIVVLTVDVGDSNFATTALPLLMYNIFDYFFPKTIEKNTFEVGEEVRINGNGTKVYIHGAEGVMYINKFPFTFIPNVPGTYQVEQTSIAGVTFIKNFFVKIPSVESNIFRTEILPQPNQVIVSVTVQDEDESRIVKIEPKNNRIEVGKTAALEVFINSTYEGQATLTLYDNEVKEKSFAIDLIKGSQKLEIEYIFSTDGLHEFTFDIVKADGTLLTKNNSFYARIYLDAYDNILILERNEGESQRLQEILSNNGAYQITVLNISEDDIPLTTEELSFYDQVILVNIANADMPEGFDEVLHSYVYDIGGSLFTVGGNDENGEANTYSREDMYGTLYQEMLPVQAINYTPPLGVVFIIDTSGSMLQTDVYYNRTYFDLAKDSIMAGVNALTERDFVGIVTLNDSASVALPMTACTQRAKIISAINELNTDGGGTVYSSAIEQAGMLLLTCENLAKYHIIMITDSMPSNSNTYANLVKDNYENYSISFSVIGVNLYTTSTEYENLQNVVQLGNGILYTAEKFTYLPSLLREDLMMPNIKEINLKQFSLQILPEYALLYDIEGVEFLTLDGFYGTKLKDGATAILTGIYDVPIYAQWDYGKGTVGSFMCDLNGTFSENLLKDGNGVLLLNKIICGTSPMKIEKIENNITTENSPTECIAFKTAFVSGGTLELILKDENGLIVQSIVLYEEVDLETVLEFVVSKIGNYTLKYNQKNIAGNIISTGELLISLST